MEEMTQETSQVTYSSFQIQTKEKDFVQQQQQQLEEPHSKDVLKDYQEDEEWQFIRDYLPSMKL